MENTPPSWTTKNWKEILFFLMTWTIGWYLFFSVIHKITSNKTCIVCQLDWLIFFTAIFLLLLPFIKTIEFGKFFKIEKEVKDAKAELKDFKSDTKDQLNMLYNNVNLLSQNISNNIVINNQVPDAETLKEEKEAVEKNNPTNNLESNKIKEEFKIDQTDEDWFWIYNLLKIRVEIEKSLRLILSKRTSIANTDEIRDIKYYSITKLFDMYLDEYPDSKSFLRSFKLFNSVANAAIHGQTINKQQYNEALGLGTYVLGDINIKIKLSNN